MFTRFMQRLREWVARRKRRRDELGVSVAWQKAARYDRSGDWS